MNQNYPEWYKHWGEYEEQYEDDDHPPTRRKRDEDYQYGYDVNEVIDQYPYLVKIEERRLTGSRRPYCVKYQVLNTWEWNVVADGAGQPIKILLSEADPGFAAYDEDMAGSRKPRQKRAIPGECHCQWQSGQ